jgi:alginate O-acetyltransferase complex protein AlgI
MVFSSAVFVFLFLPVVLGVYFLLPKRLWNAWLLLASLFFYAWGERLFVLVMLASIVANYGFGLLVERFRERPPIKLVMAGAVAVNLGLLIGYKYANFIVHSINPVLVALSLRPIALGPVHLPIGISFFTFHALSYVVDVYRGHVRAQKDPVKIALYVTLFPQLIAGPILRFHEVADQFVSRRVRLAGFAHGVQRFIIGLAKKVLVANPLASPADQIFALPVSNLTTGVAWLGIASYTLQIYFDFSGYSDMAIGLGKMFGFNFPENFNYPYISRSIKEFWRRWHISLSTWFRDYLYIPLGGNRVSQPRMYFNLLTVFFLCGLWHGASWTFVVWGLYHGTFLILERPGITQRLQTLWRPLSHIYTLLVVMVGWVFFRAETFSDATGYLRAMAGRAHGGKAHAFLPAFLSHEIELALLAGAIAATPAAKYAGLWLAEKLRARAGFAGWLAFDGARVAALCAMFLLSLMHLASGTYNPFIYFRF